MTAACLTSIDIRPTCKPSAFFDNLFWKLLTLLEIKRKIFFIKNNRFELTFFSRFVEDLVLETNWKYLNQTTDGFLSGFLEDFIDTGTCKHSKRKLIGKTPFWQFEDIFLFYQFSYSWFKIEFLNCFQRLRLSSSSTPHHLTIGWIDDVDDKNIMND